MSGLKLITYNNRPYSIIVKKNGDKVVASINVHGAIGYGVTEEEAIQNLREELGRIEQRSNRGKDKLLLG